MSEFEKPLLLEVPAELETRRLRLRAPCAGDGAMVHLSVRESLNELKPWMVWATDAYDEKSAEEWCRKAAANFLAREQLQFHVLERAGGAHLGSVGAFKFDWAVPSCEIGYWLRTSHNGQGFMTEAVVGVREMLCEQLHMRRVQIQCDEENRKSRRVAERAGFELEGILRSNVVAANNVLRNTCIYSWISAH
jgi:ribosomal-protein-serine acetyltransferase